MNNVKLGFLGFGNVGTGAYRILDQNGLKIKENEGYEITVEKILVRNVNKKRNIDAPQELFTSNAEDILDNPDISIVAEFMGGEEPAKQYILRALNNGKTVVTANKEVIAKHWEELDRTAQNNGVGLYYEASVAGGIPIIKVIGESLQANKIQKIMGIINGTTNFILTKMSEQGRDFNDVLAEAQRLGYAEPDPTADVEGYDAMYKLSILSTIAFNTRVQIDNIYREGITAVTVDDINYGKELGFALRLLAIAKNGEEGIEARIHPTFIPISHPLSSVRDAYNAVYIKGDAVGNLMLYGQGAGDMPTGSAVVSDIVTACGRMNGHKYAAFSRENGATDGIAFNNDWEAEFFVRLTVTDKPGVLSRIAGIFGKYGVSIASVLQKDHGKSEAPIIFVTHKANKVSMENAIEVIKHEEVVVRVENVICVER